MIRLKLSSWTYRLMPKFCFQESADIASLSFFMRRPIDREVWNNWCGICFSFRSIRACIGSICQIRCALCGVLFVFCLFFFAFCSFCVIPVFPLLCLNNFTYFILYQNVNWIYGFFQSGSRISIFASQYNFSVLKAVFTHVFQAIRVNWAFVTFLCLTQ